MKRLAVCVLLLVAARAHAKPRNIVFILIDDQRYDAMSFLGKSYVQTPNVDRLAKNGVYFKHALVTTPLCSPSRASILSGLYPHTHRVVDNVHAPPKGLIFFPQLLKRAGYETAFLGKWHMGEEANNDGPQPGFDHWVSFVGQGAYFPGKIPLNVNGKHVPQKKYITDELTDHAVDWLKSRSGKKPFLLYLSHKGVHVDDWRGTRDFIPAERHIDRFKNELFTPPATMFRHEDAPRWVHDRRNSRHGVEFMYQGNLDVGTHFRHYAEALLSLDESVGQVVSALEEKGWLKETLVVFMGDNGFAFGEHGHIDKRTAYEESTRVPLVAHCPALFKPGTVVEQMVANIDLAPTFLEVAGVKPPRNLDGRSFLALARGESIPWRKELLLEYFWEREYPQTPTWFALRDERWKYIEPYGLWDIEELYDLKADPAESRNLRLLPEHAATVTQMRTRLANLLKETHAEVIPFSPYTGELKRLRRAAGSKAANFPKALVAP